MKNLKPKTYHLKPNLGFTLVEMLVSISVFMVVMTVAAGSLLSIIDANGKAQSLKSAVNNLNFAIESMSKEIRVGTNYIKGDVNCSPTDSCIKFNSYRDLNGNGNKDDIVVYKLSNDSDGYFIGRCQTPAVCGFNSGTFIRMTAKGVKIDNPDGLKFYIDEGNEALNQPGRVLITVSGTAGTKVKLQTKFNLQTTVSQRSF